MQDSEQNAEICYSFDSFYCFQYNHPPPIQAVSVKVGPQHNSPVDIVLSAGDTNFNLDNFEELMYKALEDAGVERDRVNIQAGKTTKISSSGAGAQEIFDTWKVMPTGTNGFRVEDGKLYAPNAENWSGFVDPTSYDSSGKLKIKLNMAWIDIPQGMGLMFKVRPYEKVVKDTTLMDFYVVYILTGWTKHPDKYIMLIKVKGYPAFSEHMLNSGGPIPWMRKEYLNSDQGPLWPNNPNYRIHPFTKDTIYFRMAEYLTDAYIGGDAMVDAGHSDGTEPKLHTLQIEYDKGNIKAWYNDTLYIDYTDPDPIEIGGWGFGNISVVKSYYQDIEIEIGGTMDLIEAVRSASFKPQSDRFVVDVCDTPREDFKDEFQVGELAERIKLDGAYYLGLGQNTSKASINSFIKRVDRGKYFDNTSPDIYQQLASYISKIVNRREPESGRMNLLKDKEYIYITNAG